MERILVVEDYESARMLLKEELGDEGYDVITAGNGYTALEIFRNGEVDLVVLDMEIPGIDGLEFINTLKHEDRKVPIVIYTCYSSYKNNPVTQSADAYLMKSSDTSELKETVRGLLVR